MRFGPVIEMGEPPDLGVLGGEALRERSEQTADEYPEAGGVRDKAVREAQKNPGRSRESQGEMVTPEVVSATWTSLRVLLRCGSGQNFGPVRPRCRYRRSRRPSAGLARLHR